MISGTTQYLRQAVAGQCASFPTSESALLLHPMCTTFSATPAAFVRQADASPSLCRPASSNPSDLRGLSLHARPGGAPSARFHASPGPHLLPQRLTTACSSGIVRARARHERHPSQRPPSTRPSIVRRLMRHPRHLPHLRRRDREG